MTADVLLNRIAARMGYNTDSGSGTVDTNALFSFHTIALLQEALEFWWNPSGCSFIFPWNTDQDTVAITSGKVDLADVDSTYQLHLFNENPEDAPTTAIRYNIQRGTTHWHEVYGTTTNADAYAFWVKPCPTIDPDAPDDTDVPDELAMVLIPHCLMLKAESRPASRDTMAPSYAQQAAEAFSEMVSRYQSVPHWMRKEIP